MSIFDKCDDTGKLILRLMIGGLLLLHGIAKMQTGVDWMSGMLTSSGLPAFLRYGVYVGEVIAPILLVIGLWSRPAGLVVAINMLVALLLARRDDIFMIEPQGGGSSIELELMYLLGGVAVWCLGSGRYAVSRGKGRLD